MSTIELLWAAVTYVAIIAIMLITSICFGCFVRPYLQSKKAAICVGTVYFTVMLILYMVPLRFDNLAAYAIGILAAFIVMYADDRRNVEQKIFLAVTFFSLRWLTIAMAGKINFYLIEKLVMSPDIAGRPELQLGIYAGLKVLDVSISFLFIAVSAFLVNRAFESKKANMTKKELLMLIMPSLSGITGYGILQIYQNLYERDTGKSLTYISGTYGFLSFLHYLISVISIMVMVIVFQNLKARQQEAAGEKLIQSQISDMKKHIREVERLYKDIRLLRHDMGNHIQIIEHLLDKNEKKEAALYTARLRQEWQDAAFLIKSGNPVTDVILQEKKKKAEEQKIRFLCDFHYPEKTELNAFDVSVILNNGLDNSLDSVNGDLPYISISSYQNNNIFMIFISNSFEGHILMDEDTELPVSDKKGTGHGLGLLNIRRVARRYLGDIAFEQKEGKVILTIMLQL